MYSCLLQLLCTYHCSKETKEAAQRSEKVHQLLQHINQVENIVKFMARKPCAGGHGEMPEQSAVARNQSINALARLLEEAYGSEMVIRVSQ